MQETQETRVHFLGGENLMVEIYIQWQPTPMFSRRRIPWTEEPGGLRSVGSQKELDTTEVT